MLASREWLSAIMCTFMCTFMCTLVLFVVQIGQSLAMEGPDSVQLDELANLYEGVDFDHAMHVGLSDGDCARCHHHTTGTAIHDEKCGRCHKDSKATDVVACRGCHSAKRFEAEYLKGVERDAAAYHVDKPGLKGAYHLNCLECHKEMDAPAGCEDCHPRTDAGDAFFSSGEYAPQTAKRGSAHGR